MWSLVTRRIKGYKKRKKVSKPKLNNRTSLIVTVDSKEARLVHNDLVDLLLPPTASFTKVQYSVDFLL